MTSETLNSIAIIALAATSVLGQLTVRKLNKKIANLYDLWLELDDELTFTRTSLYKLEIVVKSLATKKGNK
jgi:hypothetical protein